MSTSSVQVRARQLLLERLAVDAVRALRREGVPCLLLKGPVTARLLYGRPEQHPYGDIDLLVPVERYEQARRLFLAEGFRDTADAVEGAYRADNEAHLVRDGLCLDLHRRLVGIPPRRSSAAWQALSAAAEELELQGTAVPVLPAPARALHLALHVAQSSAADKALQDLGQGLRVLDEEVWRAAAALAGALDALPAFGLGLRRLPAGAELATRLDVPQRTTADVWLRLRGAPEEALALERLRALPTWRERRTALATWLLVAQPGGPPQPGLLRRALVLLRLLMALPLWLRGLVAEARDR